MIKLVAVEDKGGARLLLRFSVGAWGVCDFTPFVQANTTMTAPLADPEFLARYFIEAGALAWPNGFELSAGSLHRKLDVTGELHRDVAAAW